MKKSKKKYFLENANEGSVSSKFFWNTVKPFISNKGTLSNDSIIIESAEDIFIIVKNGDLVSIKAKDEIRDEQVLVEIFNVFIVVLYKYSRKIIWKCPKIYRRSIRSKTR